MCPASRHSDVSRSENFNSKRNFDQSTALTLRTKGGRQSLQKFWIKKRAQETGTLEERQTILVCAYANGRI